MVTTLLEFLKYSGKMKISSSVWLKILRILSKLEMKIYTAVHDMFILPRRQKHSLNRLFPQKIKNRATMHIYMLSRSVMSNSLQPHGL